MKDKIKNALKKAKDSLFRVAPMLYIEEIENHFDKLFNVKDGERIVFHEIVSDIVHLDVHLIKPSEERPFQVLFTTGMSDLPMIMPEDASEDFKKDHERAEIYCILPADWKLENNMTNEEKDKYYWVVSSIKMAARYPHMCKTWLSHCHTLQYSEENEPLSPCTKLCAAVFYQLDHTDFGGKYGDELVGFNTKDNTRINLLCFVPIYEEEMNFKIENSAPELYKKLFGEDINDIKQLEINNNRKNVCV